MHRSSDPRARLVARRFSSLPDLARHSAAGVRPDETAVEDCPKLRARLAQVDSGPKERPCYSVSSVGLGLVTTSPSWNGHPCASILSCLRSMLRRVGALAARRGSVTPNPTRYQVLPSAMKVRTKPIRATESETPIEMKYA